MYYIIIDEKGNLYITEKSEEVDNFLSRGEGLFHVISVYGRYVTHETFQVHEKKIHRIDAVNF